MSTQTVPTPPAIVGGVCQSCFERTGRIARATHFPGNTPMCDTCFGLNIRPARLPDVTETEILRTRLASLAGQVTECREEIRQLRKMLVGIREEGATATSHPQIICDVVAQQAGVTAAVMRSRCNSPWAVRARAIAMYVMRRYGFSVTDIESALRRDHTTVLYHLSRITANLKRNRALTAKVAAAIAEVERRKS